MTREVFNEIVSEARKVYKFGGRRLEYMLVDTGETEVIIGGIRVQLTHTFLNHNFTYLPEMELLIFSE